MTDKEAFSKWWSDTFCQNGEYTKESDSALAAWLHLSALQKPVERVAVPCSNCDGKGGYGGEWMTHPESGPELVGAEECDACSGTGNEYYKLVPEELTGQMLKATLAGIAEPQDFAQQHKLREYLRDNYRKQIAAAPSVEVAK